MNASITEKEKIWDDFLARWPLEKLEQITLKEYTQAGGADSFTYWLESKTEKLGSIWGGSSFKFGMYSRRNQSDREDGAGKSYSTEYGWYNKYGASAEEAYEQVRAIVVEIANAARVGNLGVIQQANLGFAVKWKIAFLYQNRNQPCILPIYDLKHLRAAAGPVFNKFNHAELYGHLIKDCGEKPVINYGVQLWEKAVAILDSEKSNYSAREQIAKYFLSRDGFREYWENAWEQETQEFFIDYAIAIHNAGLDWWFVNSKEFLCYGRKNQDDKKGKIVGFLNPKKSGLDVYWNAIGEHDDQEQPISQAAIDFWQSDDLLALASDLYPSSREGYWPDAYSNTGTPIDEKIPSEMNNLSLNTILYGPPGTGKTYATIDAALQIVDPEFLTNHREVPGADWKTQCERRKVLKERFDQLTKEDFIRFVTFHQSFSYEDFVEGLRAETNDEKQLEYLIESGVFKRLCDDARTQGIQPEVGIRSNPRIWKISIYGTGQNPTKTYCFNHGEARIGWGKTGDLSGSYNPNEYYKSLPSGAQGTLRYFTEEIAEGDILVCIHSAEKIAGVGVVTGSYYYDLNIPDDVEFDYNHVLPVNWLYKNIQLPIHPLNDGKQFVQKTVYSLDRLTWGDLLTHIEKSGIKPAVPGVVAHTPKPHVLLIDEINRGNISRIFGELITLIEPSKRSGAEEALEATLPYSKKPFSVPSNVYLIGTMNTADRSLAGLDIALRRRFTFKEMPPRPDLLDDINIAGVNVGRLLRKMNERIEILLDRDHCLGHAYFIPLKNDPAIEKLAFIFRQQILPLLEEYFFEDWERVAWVLNDQNKSQSEYRFLKNASADLSSLSNLFGAEVAGNLQDRRWHINEKAFHNIESYRGIIGVAS